MKISESDARGSPKLLTAYKYSIHSIKDLENNEVRKTMKAFVDEDPKIAKPFYIWLCPTETNSGGELFFEVKEVNKLVLKDNIPAISTTLYSPEFDGFFYLIITDRIEN